MEFYTNAVNHKGKALLRGVDRFGKRFKRTEKIKPYLFVDDKSGEYQTVFGNKVSKVPFDSTWDANQYIKQYGEVSNMSVHGSTGWIYAYLNDKYPGTIQFDQSKINVVTLDIEVDSEGAMPSVADPVKEIISITMRVGDTFHLFALKDYDPKKSKVNGVNPRNIKFYKCSGEIDLLNKFLELWTTSEIDAITGWFIDMFDIPYIVGRIERLFGPEAVLLLSPWGIVEKRQVFINGRDNDTYNIVGISTLDYIRAYRKFTYTERESYKLNHIAEVELDEKKLDYAEHGSLAEFYKNDPQGFLDYNVHDVNLVSKLDDKLKLLSIVFTVSYLCKVNYEDAFGTVKIWECLIHNYLLTQKKVVRGRKDTDKRHFEGGYVKEPQRGMHDWVCSFDYDSLYPHIMMTVNISPETIVGHVGGTVTVDQLLSVGLTEEQKLTAGNHAIAASGHLYTRDRPGFFPTLMEELYSQRKIYKKEMIAAENDLEVVGDDSVSKSALETKVASLNALQLAIKYILNGGYGAMSNEYFLWFDMRTSESITLTGQLSIRWLANDINKLMNESFGTDEDYVIAIDTDSLYVRMSRVFEKMKKSEDPMVNVDKLDRFCKEIIGPFMDDSIKRLCDSINAYKVKLFMKRETIAERGIWQAKKKYALYTWDKEGVRYSEPKVKAKGMEMVKSSTPKPCRDKLEQAMKIVLSKDETTLQSFVKNFKAAFVKMSFDEIAFPRGINVLAKFEAGVSKTKVQGVEAAQAYNRRLDELGLSTKMPKIVDGDKVKFCHMLLPNPTGSKVFASPGPLSKELGIEQFIDKETQFEKSFVQPLRLVVDTIGWQVYKKTSLKGFFKND